MAKKDSQDWFKIYRKTKDIKVRAFAVQEWVHWSLNRLGRIAGKLTREELRNAIAKTAQEADRFCGREIVEGWTLCDGWWINVFAQTSKNPSTPVLFKMLGWDHEYHFNPKPTDTTTIELMPIRESTLGETFVKLLLRQVTRIKIGSIWINVRSGKRWKVLAIEPKVELELVDDELIDLSWYSTGFFHTILRSEDKLRSKFREVVIK